MTNPRLDPPEFITVGRVLSAHGHSGQVRVMVLSDVGHRFHVGQTLYLRGTPYPITSSAPSPPAQVILRLDGINTFSAAQALMGEQITVPENAAPPLPEGEYYHFQLLGINVFTEDGEYLGQISEILETGSNDVYVVSGTSPDLLVPALADVIITTDVNAGSMVVSLPDGLR